MTRISRRRLLEFGAAGGAALAFPNWTLVRAVAPTAALDPTSIPKYAAPLRRLPTMPRTQTPWASSGAPGRRSTSTPTISGRPRSGITTTRSA